MNIFEASIDLLEFVLTQLDSNHPERKKIELQLNELKINYKKNFLSE